MIYMIVDHRCYALTAPPMSGRFESILSIADILKDARGTADERARPFDHNQRLSYATLPR
jgi:hypothetical protein